MPPVQASVQSPPHDSWAEREDQLERFESAWSSNSPPRIEDYLASISEDRASFLVELVHADLEARISRGLPAAVESYLESYPELAASRESVVELVEAEYRLRSRQVPAPTAEQFLRRFPDLREVLAPRLAAESLGIPQAATHVGCPYCGETIQVDGSSNLFTCPGCHKSVRTDPAHPLADFRPHETRLGKFLLEALLGEGAFGSVYRAEDTVLKRKVALKVPKRPLTDEVEGRRFEREAQAVAGLTHAGIVPVYEVYQAGDRPCLVSAFVEGKTLENLARERPLPGKEAAALLVEATDAVGFAHQHHVVHRDLKPSNLLLGRLTAGFGVEGKHQPQRLFVTDFGLARRGEEESTLTVEGQILGTPAYMSPEQARGFGHKADARSDVWSLGAILYELITGSVPFRGAPHVILDQIAFGAPTRPRVLNPSIHPDLETITLKCLEKRPSRRYQDADALKQELHRYLAGLPIEARPISSVERAWRWVGRHRLLTAFMAALILLVLGSSLGTLGALHLRNRAEHAQSRAEISEARAEERHDLTLDTLGTLVFDIQDEWDGKTQLSSLRRRALENAREGLRRITRTEESSRARWTEISLHQRLGDVDLALGELTPAREHYQRAFTLVDALREDADLARLRRTLSHNHYRLGQVERREGRVSDAAKHLAEALTHARAAAAAEPEGQAPARQVLLVLLELADVRRAAGERAAACTALLEARAVAMRWLEQEPRSFAFLSSLTDAHRQLGTLHLELQEPELAHEHHVQAVAAAERLIAEHPRNAAARGKLAESLYWLGDTALAKRNLSKAENYYRKAATRRAEQLRLDPFAVVTGHGLALEAARFADVLAQRGEAAEAVAQYEKALGHFEGHLQEARRDARARHDLGAAQERYALLLRRLGQFSKARSLLVQSLRHREALAHLDSRNSQVWLLVTTSLANLGLVELDCLDPAAAERWHRQALTLLERLGAENLVPNSREHQAALSFHQKRLAALPALARAITDPAATGGPVPQSPPEWLYRRAHALAGVRKQDESLAVLEQLRNCPSKDPFYHLRGGQLCAKWLNQLPPESDLRKRFTELTLDLLTAAVQAGSRDLAAFRFHPDLAAVRHEARFQQLLAKLETLFPTTRPTGT